MSVRFEAGAGRFDPPTSVRAMCARLALAWGLALAVAVLASVYGGLSAP